MTTIPQPAARASATVFGFVMVASADVGSHGLAFAAGVLALIAVGVGMVYRPAATLAVLLCVGTIAVSNPMPALTALSGLCAAAYLVCRHSVGTPFGAVVGSGATIVAALGFTFVGLVAMLFPLQLPWLPLAAPLAVLAIYVLATRPFLG